MLKWTVGNNKNIITSTPSICSSDFLSGTTTSYSSISSISMSSTLKPHPQQSVPIIETSGNINKENGTNQLHTIKQYKTDSFVVLPNSQVKLDPATVMALRDVSNQQSTSSCTFKYQYHSTLSTSYQKNIINNNEKNIENKSSMLRLPWNVHYQECISKRDQHSHDNHKLPTYFADFPIRNIQCLPSTSKFPHAYGSKNRSNEINTLRLGPFDEPEELFHKDLPSDWRYEIKSNNIATISLDSTSNLYSAEDRSVTLNTVNSDLTSDYSCSSNNSNRSNLINLLNTKNKILKRKSETIDKNDNNLTYIVNTNLSGVHEFQRSNKCKRQRFPVCPDTFVFSTSPNAKSNYEEFFDYSTLVEDNSNVLYHNESDVDVLKKAVSTPKPGCHFDLTQDVFLSPSMRPLYDSAILKTITTFNNQISIKNNDSNTTVIPNNDRTWDSHKQLFLNDQREEDLSSFGNSLADAQIKNNSYNEYPVEIQQLPEIFPSSCSNLSFTSSEKSMGLKDFNSSGQLELRIYYNFGILTIHILQAKHLDTMIKQSICNAYVKVNLLPQNSKKKIYRTCVRKNSFNPKFNHKFSLEIHSSDLDKQIVISTWHRDRRKRKSEFLGCMSFPIKNILKKEINGYYKLSTKNLNETFNRYNFPNTSIKSHNEGNGKLTNDLTCSNITVHDENKRTNIKWQLPKIKFSSDVGSGVIV